MTGSFRICVLLAVVFLSGCGSESSDQPEIGSFSAKSFSNAFWVEDTLTNSYASFQSKGDLEAFCKSFCTQENSSNGMRRTCNIPTVVHIDGGNSLSYCDWRNDFNNSQCVILGKIQDSGDVDLAVQGLNWIKVRPVSSDTLDIGVENSYGARSIVVNRTGLSRILELQNLLSYCGM